MIESLVWCKKISHWGENYSDKTILLIDYATMSAGLVDIMKFICCYVMLAEERGWIPYVLLNRFPNQYLVSEDDNMWEYFFENVIEITIDEIRHCKNVISVYENGNPLMNFRVNPYLQEMHGRLMSTETKKVDVFGELKNKVRLRKEIVEKIQT